MLKKLEFPPDEELEIAAKRLVHIHVVYFMCTFGADLVYCLVCQIQTRDKQKMVNSFDLDASGWRFEALRDFHGKVCICIPTSVLW